MRVVFWRDKNGFPTYWALQIVGWIALSLLILVCVLPYLDKPGMLRANVISILVMFSLTFFLRPICRRLWQHRSSWFALVSWAFLWSVLGGASSDLICETVIGGFHQIKWGEYLVDALQSTVVFFLWCSLYFSVKQWQQATSERERLLRAEAEIREAKLSALRYQLNPHFLFNSLNAVSTLILDGDAPAATRMLAQIGELLRSTLNGEVIAEISLADEIAFTERYLAIEQSRLGHRLRVVMQIEPESLHALVPSMLLQPLVENAIRHGIAPLLEGGTLLISARRKDQRLLIGVRNTGLIGETGAEASNSGIGLRNTTERLKTLYPGNHRFALSWPEDGGCHLEIEIPFRPAALPAIEPEAVVCAR